MAIIVLRSKNAQKKNVYYEFDTASEPLGEGGMGKVYRGKQVSEITGMTRDVAIKFMFDGLPQSVIDRARREASIRMVSENLVEMIDFIETTSEGPNGTVRSHYHVVSELLTGVMLGDLLNGVVTAKDGHVITFAQNLYNKYKEDRAGFALIIMKSIASGIMQLHDKGYIHRDIDPTNIMITEDGKIKLIDFGIAKKLPGNNPTSSERLTTQDRSLTMTGQFMGKPQYAAPELVVGDINYQNETTDIYAMGILLYQLLVGKLPFNGPVTKILDAQKNTKTPVKGIINVEHQGDFRSIVAKATEKEQDNRYQSASEFRAALDAVGTGGRKTNWWYYVAGVVVVLAIAAGIYAWKANGGGPGSDPKEHAKIMDELYNSETARDGWAHLKEGKDADALYLQSLIYSEEQMPDSIIVIKKNLEGVVAADNKTANSLLLKAYKADPKNAKVLYEMGLNSYYGLKHGNEVIVVDDWDKAKQYFTEAMNCAKASGDVALQSRAQEKIKEIDSSYE